MCFKTTTTTTTSLSNNIPTRTDPPPPSLAMLTTLLPQSSYDAPPVLPATPMPPPTSPIAARAACRRGSISSSRAASRAAISPATSAILASVPGLPPTERLKPAAAAVPAMAGRRTRGAGLGTPAKRRLAASILWEMRTKTSLSSDSELSAARAVGGQEAVVEVWGNCWGSVCGRRARAMSGSAWGGFIVCTCGF